MKTERRAFAERRATARLGDPAPRARAPALTDTARTIRATMPRRSFSTRSALRTSPLPRATGCRWRPRRAARAQDARRTPHPGAPAVGLPHGRQLVRRPRDPRDARRPRAALADRGALPRRVCAVDRSQRASNACSTSAPDRAASRSRPRLPAGARGRDRCLAAGLCALARANVRRHRPRAAACACCAPMSMKASEARRYDIVVSNPPYVSVAEMLRLPREHRAEPAIGLRAARAGLAIVERIVAGAKRHLDPGGILVVEVGNAAARVRAPLPRTASAHVARVRARDSPRFFLLRAADLPG